MLHFRSSLTRAKVKLAWRPEVNYYEINTKRHTREHYLKRESFPWCIFIFLVPHLISITKLPKPPAQSEKSADKVIKNSPLYRQRNSSDWSKYEFFHLDCFSSSYAWSENFRVFRRPSAFAKFNIIKYSVHILVSQVIRYTLYSKGMINKNSMINLCRF